MSKPEPGLTPQVAIAIAVVMLAMALPILCVVLALKGGIRLHPQATPEPTPVVAKQALPPEALGGLRDSLEKAVDAKMPPADSGLDGAQTIPLTASDLAAAGKEVLSLVHDFGGNALPPEESAQSVHIVAQLDTAWIPAFSACLRQGTPKPAALPTASGSTDFCDILITHSK